MIELKKARKLLIKAYNELGKSLNEVDILLKSIKFSEIKQSNETSHEKR